MRKCRASLNRKLVFDTRRMSSSQKGDPMPKAKSAIQPGEGYWAQVAGATAAGLNDVIRTKGARPNALPIGLVKESRRFLRIALPVGRPALAGGGDKVHLIAAEAVTMTSPTTAHPLHSIKVSIEQYDNLLRRLSSGSQLNQRDLRTAIELQQFLTNFYRSYETQRTGAFVARQAFA
jgi:hypothetical protein